MMTSMAQGGGMPGMPGLPGGGPMGGMARRGGGKSKAAPKKAKARRVSGNPAKRAQELRSAAEKAQAGRNGANPFALPTPDAGPRWPTTSSSPLSSPSTFRRSSLPPLIPHPVLSRRRDPPR
jgi:hypothetical protein